MNDLVKRFRVPAIIAAILLAAYVYGNHRGIRYCNCKATEDWKPGEAKNTSRSSGGRSHFYHK